MADMADSLTLNQILEALVPTWTYANHTTEDGTFVRPDYRRALDDAWTDIVGYAGTRPKEPEAALPLNVAMTRWETRL